jgi:hypothetical protein
MRVIDAMTHVSSIYISTELLEITQNGTKFSDLPVFLRAVSHKSSAKHVSVLYLFQLVNVGKSW